MSAAAGLPVQSESCRVFDWPIMEAALFEQCSDAAGNSGPAHDAIERVPAVIEQNATPRYRRINSPVLAAVSEQQRPQAECAESANGTVRTAPIAPSSTSAEILRQIGALSQL